MVIIYHFYWLILILLFRLSLSLCSYSDYYPSSSSTSFIWCSSFVSLLLFIFLIAYWLLTALWPFLLGLSFPLQSSLLLHRFRRLILFFVAPFPFLCCFVVFSCCCPFLFDCFALCLLSSVLFLFLLSLIFLLLTVSYSVLLFNANIW